MNKEKLYKWAWARNPYNCDKGEYKEIVPATKLGIFDRVLVELVCMIEQECLGLTEAKAQQLWMLRSRFVELEEGDE